MPATLLLPIALGFSPVATPRLKLELSTTSPTVTVGQPLPLKATITNLGREAVRLVLPNDGSAWGWRTPVIGWSVLSGTAAKHPREVPVVRTPRCGNMNPLMPEDFIALAPGQSAEVVNGWATPPAAQKAGDYRVRLYFVNDPKRDGSASGEKNPLVVGTAPVRLVSNEVVVRVFDLP